MLIWGRGLALIFRRPRVKSANRWYWMWIKPALIAYLVAGLIPVSAWGQQPLSVIEWLGEHPPPDFSGSVLLEPPISETALHPVIDVSPLEALAEPVGLVPDNVTGLPLALWGSSDPDVLAGLIANVAVAESPAMQRLLYTLLLSETLPPADRNAAETLLLARIDRLLELGATDPAQALVYQAGPTKSTARFARWFDATLLTGDEDSSCAALVPAPHLSSDYAARIFCGARLGDWQTAALTLEVAHALALLPPDKLALLDRFLSPGVFEGAPPLPVPDNPAPLTFRLFETIGERLPTASLPRAFSTADLRDVAGWKAQLEAAERLVSVGALSPNRLLGLYTERLPAASGGIWDRVAALQRFETALDTGSAAAVAKTLPIVWNAMRSVRLEVPFASLFAERLAAQDLDDPAADMLAWQVRLLSDGYETAAQFPPDETARSAFLVALAQGAPGRIPASDATMQAISDGFSNDTHLPDDLQRLLDAGQLGEVILRAMVLMDSGMRGNPVELAAALATLRSVGMEDTARRAALQLLLLGQG